MSSPTPPIRSLCWLLPLRRLRFADVHVAQRRRVIFNRRGDQNSGDSSVHATNSATITSTVVMKIVIARCFTVPAVRFYRPCRIARSKNLSVSGASFTCNFKGCAAQFRAFRQRLILEHPRPTHAPSGPLTSAVTQFLALATG